LSCRPMRRFARNRRPRTAFLQFPLMTTPLLVRYRWINGRIGLRNRPNHQTATTISILDAIIAGSAVAICWHVRLNRRWERRSGRCPAMLPNGWNYRAGLAMIY
jgi:hypothetical protein